MRKLHIGCLATLIAAIAMAWLRVEPDDTRQLSKWDGGGGNDENLNARIRLILRRAGSMELNAHLLTPWELVHAMLALGPMVEVSTPTERVAVKEYFARGAYRGGGMYERRGAYIGLRRSTFPGELERHPNQFLAYFAESGLPEHFEIDAGTRQLTLSDFIESVKATIRMDEELTFTLIALSQYLQANETWTSADGSRVTLALIAERELARERHELACGGTHSLFALARARDALASNSAIAERLDACLREQVSRLRMLQRGDGMLPLLAADGGFAPSTWAVLATGHNLEWLAVALSPAELREGWVVSAVNYLVKELEHAELDVMPAEALFHAIHGLRLYRDATGAEQHVALL